MFFCLIGISKCVEGNGKIVVRLWIIWLGDECPPNQFGGSFKTVGLDTQQAINIVGVGVVGVFA